MAHPSRYLFVLGTVLLASAVVHAISKLADNGILLEAALEFVLIAFSGLLVLYAGRSLAGSEIDPDLYSRIALWCLGGVGVMVVFLLLRALHPGIANPFSHATRAIALAIGSIAGLGIGIHDARALTRERELDRRNEALRGIRADLEAALDEVEASNERLEQFASIASHDLREPLRMVSSYLSLLEDRYGDDLDDDGREFLAFAVDGAERMRSMIESLLAYSRVDAAEPPTEPVALEAALEDALADLRVQIDERDAEIVADPLPSVRGDEDQFRQLFQNLVSNALAYADGPPRIRVAADRRDGDWQISVRDNGIGIEPAAQERIFEIFQRLHAADEREGSGIGLALCRRIVERHGGEIWVDSEPGAGSTFSFTLPRA